MNVIPRTISLIRDILENTINFITLRDGFLRGGLKGNDQKKYTLEVKTVKARKSDGLV